MMLEQWQKCLAILSESQVKRLIKSLHIEVGSGGDIDPLACVKLALADWIAHLGLFTDAQVNELIGAINPQLDEFVASLEGDSIPVFTVAICDGRWVSCVGRESFFDVKEYEEIKQLPEYCVTHIMCDVTQLYARMKHRVTRMEGSKEALDVTN